MMFVITGCAAIEKGSNSSASTENLAVSETSKKEEPQTPYFSSNTESNESQQDVTNTARALVA